MFQWKGFHILHMTVPTLYIVTFKISLLILKNTYLKSWSNNNNIGSINVLFNVFIRSL